MAETQTPPIEARIAALEAKVSWFESVLRHIPGLPDQYRLLEGPPGVFAIVCLGLPPPDLSFFGKAVWSFMRQKPQGEKEIPVDPWKHLVFRRHPWRKQLYVRGRNMTVRQLVGGVRANKLSEEQAAANYDLPVEAIREALAYAEENAALLDLEAAYERFLLDQEGKRRGPETVS